MSLSTIFPIHPIDTKPHMSARNRTLSAFKFFCVWSASFGMAGAILLAVVLAAGTYADYRKGRTYCPDKPVPSLEQARTVAQAELVQAAQMVRMDIDRFYLVNVGNPGGDTKVWEFYFQVKGDIERPRQIKIPVDRCLHSYAIPFDVEDWGDSGSK
jgi:hypothetical protein